MATIINGVVYHRINTASWFKSNNPILGNGELAIEEDTHKIKAGDGTTNYNDLVYISGSGITSNPLYNQKSCGIIIPMYIYPSDIWTNTDYDGVYELARSNKSVPIIMIVNPEDGAGSEVDGNYTYAIKKAISAGITPIGYVPTDYGNNSNAISEIDNWLNKYPDIQGIFYDEVQYDNSEAEYYTELVNWAKTNGLMINVGNPGSPSNIGLYDYFDIVIEWETDAGYPSESEMKSNWEGGSAEISLYKRGLLEIGLSSWDATTFDEVLKYYGWVYVTDDTMSPNPWDSVSGYMSNMITAIKNNQ